MPATQKAKTGQTPKRATGSKAKAVKTTGVIMDAEDLETLRRVALLRVIRGDSDRASVSDIVREAVAEFIKNHGLDAEAAQVAALEVSSQGKH